MSIPCFVEIPEAWKAPFGPYQQAPPEFGGKWFKVNPFTGPEPWKIEVSVKDVLPVGFEDIFGPRPRSEDFRDEPNPSRAFRVATETWEQDLKYFYAVGPPEWATPEQVALAADTARFWDMGTPAFYTGRYGSMVRFPEAYPYTRFESTAWSVINAMHHEVAAYQIQLWQEGFMPDGRHPFVPTDLFIAE